MSLNSIAAALCLLPPALSFGASLAEAGWRDNAVSQKNYTGSVSTVQRMPNQSMQKVCVESSPKPSPDAFSGPCVRWEMHPAPQIN